MGDKNHIRTLGDYSKPSHEGYRNTIVLPDPNQHLKDFLKLVDSLDLDGENRERTHLRLFQFSLCDQASNWLERLPAGSISTWEDLTTRFLAQFFPPGRTAKLRNNILMFQQHHGESLSEARTSFKDLLQNVPRHGIDLWLQDLALYDNESWNDPRDFAKPVKAIALPQDVPNTSDRRLIELENQVQRLMEAHLAPTQPTQVDKITTSCEIYSGPHDTQYCMKDPKQAFIEYASSHTDEAGGKWYTFKPEQNNLGDTYNLSWKSHPNLRWRQPQNSQNNFSNPSNRFQPNGSISNRSFNKHPQNFNNQSNIEGMVSEFMAYQDARLSKFEANFKRQQGEMTNKIDTVLKAITDRIAGTLPSNAVKNLKLGTTSVLSARSYPTIDPQCSSHPSNSINAIKAHFKEATISQTSLQQPEIENKPSQPEEPEPTLEDEFQDLHLNLPLRIGKSGSAFVQGEIPAKIEDPEIFTLPCRLGDSKSFDTLADLGSCVNIIPLYLFKKINIGLLEETDHIFGLADGTKSYPVGIVKDVEVHIGKLKLLNDFYVLDMKKDPETPLLVGRGFLATANAVIDCWMAKIAVGKRTTGSVFDVKGVELGKAHKGTLIRDAELNPFKDTLVFRRMVEFLGAIPINLKCNMWESEDLIKKPINWDKPPKDRDGAWHAKIRLIDPDGEEFTNLQTIPTTRSFSKEKSPE
ncbi:MAK10-like protein [Tanacetum coccineum]